MLALRALRFQVAGSGSQARGGRWLSLVRGSLVGCDGDGRSRCGEVCRGDLEFCAGGAGVQPLVPDGDDEVGVGEGQGAGEVHGVGAAQGIGAGQLAGAVFDGCGELDEAYRGPVLFPVLLGGV